MRAFASLERVLGGGRRDAGVLLMCRPLAFVLVAAVVVGLAGGADARRVAPAGPNATFVVTGHGWGHGVGMSQYGAYGFAQHGYTYPKIVTHYFPGTQLGPAPVTKVRVLLKAGAATLKVGSVDDFTVRDATGETHDVGAGTYTLTKALKLKFDDATTARALPGPLLFQPGSSPLALARRYRGAIQVDVDNGKLRAINVVGLEQYLYGVVPSEMPYTWAPEALKAQAVVARSYALATKRAGAFDLYPDTRSQMYLGIDHEKPSTNTAVDATAGKVLLYNGQVAKTFFYSTSGGRTASSEDVWGTAVPYLVSVPDPYDSISPYHDWGPFVFGGAKLGRALRAGGAVQDVRTSVNSSGRVTSMTVVTGTSEKSINATALRKILGLRSTWFSVGVMSLSGPGGAVTYGTRTRLSGVARGLRGIVLQQRVGGAWNTVGSLAPAADGSLSVPVRPPATTDYRLAAAKVTGATAHVAVAPFVRLTAPRTQQALGGIVRPRVAGAAVAIQRQQGAGWTTVARTTVEANGAFVAQLQLTAGTYRARVAPGHGLVAGLSQVLQVSTS